MLTASLVASRLVSMTFIPLLGFHLLRPSKRREPSIEERRNTGFAKHYYRVVGAAIRPRVLVLAGAAASNPSPRSWEAVGHASGPRWPPQRQSNYAQLVIKLEDKHLTRHLLQPLQKALSSRIAGARVDVRELEAGPAVGVPVSIRIAGAEIGTLREIAGRVEAALSKAPNAERVRDNWGAGNLYVYSGENAAAKLPLQQIAELGFGVKAAKIVRRDHARTITVGAFPGGGRTAQRSAGPGASRPRAHRTRVATRLFAHDRRRVRRQQKSFKDLVVVLVISISAIFVALVLQFKNAPKPLIVFAAIPSGLWPHWWGWR